MYLWVGDQQIVTHYLNLITHKLSNLGVVGPVILVKGILNGKNGVLAHKRLIQLDEIVTLQLCAPIVVLFSEARDTGQNKPDVGFQNR